MRSSRVVVAMLFVSACGGLDPSFEPGGTDGDALMLHAQPVASSARFEVVVGATGQAPTVKVIYSGPRGSAGAFQAAVVASLMGAQPSKSPLGYYMVRGQDGATKIGPVAVRVRKSAGVIATVARRYGFSAAASGSKL